ncbi:MAG TPA: ABC transporter substrate-binding protein [Segeticoccus sp.]|uniref:ABC transporter substrate-binding protein n=1 Tax=Segeticoccus sp. TaxID=2706531 RepID=UPI002D7E8F5B|nr:ABC transporter substrate-binding protein [Segeticoccus sp.]HET8600526.1 ABC transporter substrate-binding protein [Segeticoccus sp.]
MPRSKAHGTVVLAATLAASTTIAIAGCAGGSSGAGQPSGQQGAATAGNNAAAGGNSSQLTIAVGGQSALVYLPVTLAQQLGYYKQAGVDPKLLNFDGGSKAIEAMLGGSAQITATSYDHAIQLQGKHKDVSCFVNYLALPSLVLAVSPKHRNEVSSIADLKGKPVGVTAPGSGTEFFLDHLLGKAGMKSDSVSIVAVGVGSTAVSAMEQGKVYAAVMAEPDVTVTKSRAGGQLRLLADARTKQGTEQAMGVSNYPFTCLTAPNDWLKQNPDTARKLASAIVKTLTWIRTHNAQQIAAKMPPEFVGDKPSLYAKAVNNTKPGFDTNGAVTKQGAQAVLKQLVSGGVVSNDIDLSKTYTNQYLPQQ